APGEIGGSVGGAGISWFADNVASGSVTLDAQTPLNASGWCTFTATAGNATVGWFSADTYAAPDTAPHQFIGWRQDGSTIRPALGTTGSSFVDGTAVPISSGNSFHWALSYNPTGGDNACGQITLSIGGASSTLSL